MNRMGTAGAWVCGVLALGACRSNNAATATAPAAELPSVVTAPANGRVPVIVDGVGYHPATIQTQPGRPITLVFTRTSDDGCGQQVVIPSEHIQRDLPLNQPVEVTVTPAAAGSIAFTCGMGMWRGAVVAR